MIRIVKYQEETKIKSVDTAIMVDASALIGQYNWGQANDQLKLLNSLNYKGYSDWRLPTKDELNVLYLNKDFVGGFSTYLYWSSSEYNADYAWYQNFTNGGQNYGSKLNYGYVRCVRSLTI